MHGIPALLREFDPKITTPWKDLVSLELDAINRRITQAKNEEKREAWRIVLCLKKVHLKTQPKNNVTADLTVRTVNDFSLLMQTMLFKPLSKVVATRGLGWRDLVYLSRQELLAFDGVTLDNIDRLTRILGHVKEAMKAIGVPSIVPGVCLPLERMRLELLTIEFRPRLPCPNKSLWQHLPRL